MPRGVPYVFCRYALLDDGEPLSAYQQLATLKRITGTIVAHRKPEASSDEADTFSMRAAERVVSAEKILTWDVGFYVRLRSSARYDRRADDVAITVTPDDGIRYTSFVAIPRLGVVAVNDRSGDHYLGAQPGIARFKTVFKNTVPNGEAQIVLGATHADARKALSDWSISKFSFTVWPFNPHPRDPGRKLSELFERDGIGKLTGSATPMPGKEMRLREGGYIEETLGLTEAGYGQIGVDGTTPEGREAALRKPQFSLDKKVNEKTQAAPQILRVYIEPQETEKKEHTEAARALIEFYGDE